ncbi:hypothetical protein EYC84_007894 [Monilinia fructicola]|uniref:Uncharacterized protein n=1 Tax=Monilinia fructicola TaxID=38448 RepID=A0A5M9JJK6_MONFR|nr:hypothetical protein EYC84_007894 [Monilinia fructicola]
MIAEAGVDKIDDNELFHTRRMNDLMGWMNVYCSLFVFFGFFLVCLFFGLFFSSTFLLHLANGIWGFWLWAFGSVA